MMVQRFFENLSHTIKTELMKMNGTLTDIKLVNAQDAASDESTDIKETEVRDIQLDEKIPGNGKNPNSSGKLEEWDDIDEFGPVLPLGTDMLKKKPVYRFVKRFFDIFLSLFALIVLSPILLLVSIAIVIDDPKGGPVFVQTRLGKNKKPFKMYKFRSMEVDAEAKLDKSKNKKKDGGPAFKDPNDDRITRVGRFIRKTSIDELLQLINVIKGDMSIVGPRPPLPDEVEDYNTFSMQRLLIRPGLTCFWQTTKDRDSVPFKEWMKMDVKYIHKCSLWVDFKLIFKTFAIVFTANGN